MKQIEMEEFCNNSRSYLNTSGVGEAVSTSLSNLYKLEKKPANPIEFIRRNLPPTQKETVAELTAELADLNNDIEKLRSMLPKVEPIKDTNSVENDESNELNSNFEANLEEFEPKTTDTEVNPNDLENQNKADIEVNPDNLENQKVHQEPIGMEIVNESNELNSNIEANLEEFEPKKADTEVNADGVENPNKADTEANPDDLEAQKEHQ